MSNYKIELKITGQLIGKGYAVSLEGHDIQLKENPEHVYTRTFDSFPVDEPLDVLIVLRGWFGTEWTVVLKVNDVVRLTQNGTFSKKGFVNISQQINLP